MKIDDIIRKCIEIPGISIQRSDFSTELLLKKKEGKGSMTFFPLFPGVTIAYIFVNSPTWTAPNFREDSSIDKGPFLMKLSSPKFGAAHVGEFIKIYAIVSPGKS